MNFTTSSTRTFSIIIAVNKFPWSCNPERGWAEEGRSDGVREEGRREGKGRGREGGGKGREVKRRRGRKGRRKKGKEKEGREWSGRTSRTTSWRVNRLLEIAFDNEEVCEVTL